MKRANLLVESKQHWGPLRVSLVYESASLKILTFQFDPGQSLLMYSDQMEGEMSLVVIDGHGEFVGEEARKRPLKRGDVIVSEMAEPHTFQATTPLRLLVTITPRGSSGEAETHAPHLWWTVAPKLGTVATNTKTADEWPSTFVSH